MRRARAGPGLTEVRCGRIQGDKVGDFSIKLSFNQDVAWTKSTKYMLTDLKWLMSYIC